MKLKSFSAVLMLGACLMGPAGTSPCLGQSAAGLPPGVQDVVKLVKAGLGEEVVLAHIRNTGAYYNLSADQIIYLNSQRVTQGEITALLRPGARAAAPTPTPAPVSAPLVPPPDNAPPPALVASAAPGLDSFHAQLAPYGTWVNMPGYGLCWRPAVALNDPNWRPYSDQGYWMYTADGWYWQSDYPWGAIAFHYGRWYRDSLGWLWVPGYDWAPAWVCWRQADGYCGWAPLPPGAVYRAGVGLMFGGRVAVDVDFGLGPDAFVFVSYNHFWDHHLRGYLLPHERVRLAYGRSVIHNGYHVERGHFVVEGLGHEHVALVTHHDVRVETPARHWDSVGHGGPEQRGERDSRHDHEDRHGR